jgi:predicted signal transduction protein with EAL and GGDEF domain
VAEASIVATRLLTALQDPVVIDGHQLLVHVSIGIADSDLARSRLAEDLLRDADLAMYLAKSSGRNRFVTYTAGVDQTVRQRAELATDIRYAVEAGEFELHYQPVVLGFDGSLLALRRSCAGTIRSVDWFPPPSSFLWPRRPAKFVPLAPGSSAQPRPRSQHGKAPWSGVRTFDWPSISLPYRCVAMTW